MSTAVLKNARTEWRNVRFHAMTKTMLALLEAFRIRQQEDINNECDRIKIKILQGACELLAEIALRSGSPSVHSLFDEDNSNAMLFVEHGFEDAHSTENDLWYPLHWAIVLGPTHKQDALSLLQLQPNLCRERMRSPPSFLPMHVLLSLRHPDLDTFNALIALHPESLSATSEYQGPSSTFPVVPAMIAAKYCQSTAMFHTLLQLNPVLRVSGISPTGRVYELTSLHAACMNKYPPAFDLILAADPSAAAVADSRGRYPVHIAVSMGNTHVINRSLKDASNGILVLNTTRYLLHEVLMNYYGLIPDIVACKTINCILSTPSGILDILLRHPDDCEMLPVNIAARFSSKIVIMHYFGKLADSIWSRYGELFDREKLLHNICNNRYLSDDDRKDCIKALEQRLDSAFNDSLTTLAHHPLIRDDTTSIVLSSDMYCFLLKRYPYLANIRSADMQLLVSNYFVLNFERGTNKIFPPAANECIIINLHTPTLAEDCHDCFDLSVFKLLLQLTEGCLSEIREIYRRVVWIQSKNPDSQFCKDVLRCFLNVYSQFDRENCKELNYQARRIALNLGSTDRSRSPSGVTTCSEDSIDREKTKLRGPSSLFHNINISSHPLLFRRIVKFL